MDERHGSNISAEHLFEVVDAPQKHVGLKLARWIVALGLALLGGCSNWGFAHASPAEQTAGSTDIRVSARAAVTIDASSGAVLFSHNPFDELPPASLTKMVTALVALERGTLDQPIEPRHDFDVEPIVIGIGAGDSLRLEDALYGLLLNSGNDVGLAIAESVGRGSVARFVGWMNEVPRRLGLSHTRFANPHGLDEPGHVSSAYDMAVIGRALMQEPVLARIVGERRRVVDGPPRWLFQTTNPLLGTYAGADGIKTGYDILAGRCLVGTAAREGRRAIAVVLNSDRYAADVATLLDAAFADPNWGRSPDRRSELPGIVRADLEGTATSVSRALSVAAAGSSAR